MFLVTGKAKQKSRPAERKAVVPWCVYAPQVPQLKEDPTLQSLNEADHSCAPQRAIRAVHQMQQSLTQFLPEL